MNNEIQALNDRLTKAGQSFMGHEARIAALEAQVQKLTELLSGGIPSQKEPFYGGFEIPENHKLRRCIIAGKSDGLQLLTIKSQSKSGKTVYKKVSDPAPKSGWLQGSYKGLYCARVLVQDGLDKAHRVVSSQGTEGYFTLLIAANLGGKDLEYPVPSISTDWDDHGKVGYTSIGGTIKTDKSGNAAKSILAALANSRPEDLANPLRISWEVSEFGRRYMDLGPQVVAGDRIISLYQNPKANKGIFNPEKNGAASDPLFFATAIYMAINNYAKVRMILEGIDREEFSNVLEAEVWRTVNECFWSRESYAAFRRYAATQDMTWPQIIDCLTDLSYAANFSYEGVDNKAQVDRAIEGFHNA